MTENMDPSWLGEDDIYRENILDHYKNPRNFGELEPCSFSHYELNPVCGDMIRLFVNIEKEKVEDVKFKGNGCAISMAATSMLTEKLKGKSLGEVKKLNKEDIMEMLGIELGIVRMKCGLLCLNTLVKGISEMEGKNGL